MATQKLKIFMLFLMLQQLLLETEKLVKVFSIVQILQVHQQQKLQL